MANLKSISAKQISLVLEMSRSLAVVLELDELLPLMAEGACKLLDCRRASVWVHDSKLRQLRTHVALRSAEIVVPDTSGVVGAAFSQNAVLNISRPYEDPRFNAESDRRSGFITESLLAAPTVDLQAQPVGVIQAINKTGGPFNEGDEALIGLLADQAAVAIQRHMLHLAATDAEAMRREMKLARTVQLALIPSMPPQLPGLLAAGWTKPASLTGGDCYDYWITPNGRLAVLVADASGHGIGPAMVVSQVRTMVRLLCESGDGSRLDPTTILNSINRRLECDLSPGQFVTAFLAFIDPDGEIIWASAGHGPTLLRKSPESPAEWIGSSGAPLGIVPDCFIDSDGPPAPMHLEKGGTLLAMSDGVFEAFDPKGTQFGVPRVMEILDRPNQTPAKLVAELKQALDEWHHHDDPKDDQTLVAVQREI